MHNLTTLFDETTSRHSHLCPRQVLGVRMGLAGARALGLEIPCPDKRLLVIIETDGCFADGIEVACGVSVGKRTLRVEDYGKAAATFVDTWTGRAVRLAPCPGIRQLAAHYAPGEPDHYAAMLTGYQRVPDEDLFSYQQVALVTPVAQIVSRPGLRVSCELCGEEIINEREVVSDEKVLCRSCAGESYYLQPVEFPIEIKGVTAKTR